MKKNHMLSVEFYKDHLKFQHDGVSKIITHYFLFLIFGENGQNWVILRAKMTSYVKIRGKLSSNFFPKSY